MFAAVLAAVDRVLQDVRKLEASNGLAVVFSQEHLGWPKPAEEAWSFIVNDLDTFDFRSIGGVERARGRKVSDHGLVLSDSAPGQGCPLKGGSGDFPLYRPYTIYTKENHTLPSALNAAKELVRTKNSDNIYYILIINIVKVRRCGLSKGCAIIISCRYCPRKSPRRLRNSASCRALGPRVPSV